MDPATPRSLRRDAQARRDALLDAVGELLAERGQDFTLSQVAGRAGTSVATAYRRFPDAAAAIAAYYAHLTDLLMDTLEAIDVPDDPARELHLVCHAWIGHAYSWGPSAVYLRSPQGILARHEAGDPFISRLYARLERVLHRCRQAGVLPAQHVPYAVLLWMTLFDERVVADATGTLGWSVERTTRHLTAALLAALRDPAR